MVRRCLVLSGWDSDANADGCLVGLGQRSAGDSQLRSDDQLSVLDNTDDHSGLLHLAYSAL